MEYVIKKFAGRTPVHDRWYVTNKSDSKEYYLDSGLGGFHFNENMHYFHSLENAAFALGEWAKEERIAREQENAD